MNTVESGTAAFLLFGRHVFMSAGIPGDDYPGQSDREEIAAAVGAAVSGVLRAGGRLLFGGQPDVVPLVLQTARDLAGRGVALWSVTPPVTLYQSRLYAGQRPPAVTELLTSGLARLELTEAAPGERPERGHNARSLALLRDAMLSADTDPVAGIFIGGMDGVAAEFGKFRESFPGRPAYVFGAPGGEARRLALAAPSADPAVPFARKLADSRRYDELAAEMVRDIAHRLGS